MPQLQYTLFLWLRGAFPRRIAYQLLTKGIVASVDDMIAGKTVLPNFTINLATATYKDGQFSMTEANPSDPKPAGKSTPCLRIADPSTGSVRFIHESTSIALYIEDQFPEFSPMLGRDPVDRAVALDMINVVNLLGHDFTYYLRHAAPITEVWSHLPNADRSHGAARNALDCMIRNLLKLQDWAGDALARGEFLTPGVEGPGLVDVSLAANMRYIQLGYAFEALEDERLGPLRGWWERLRGVDWWHGLEEEGEVHPPELMFPKEIREV